MNQTLFERDDRKDQPTLPYTRQELIGLFSILGFQPQKVEMEFDPDRRNHRGEVPLDKIKFYFLISDCEPIEKKLLSGESIMISFADISKASLEWKNYLEIANSRLRNYAPQ